MGRGDEALKARWVPVWTWLGSSAPDANGSLVEAGARPLRERDLESDPLFDALTEARAEGAPKSSIRSRTFRTSDLLTRPKHSLTLPRSEGELRDEFDLRLPQVRLWMKDCVESDQVVRRERPVRYVIRDAEPSLSTLTESPLRLTPAGRLHRPTM